MLDFANDKGQDCLSPLECPHDVNIDRSRYDRLVDMGWLTPFKTNISDVEYQATDKGRAAAVADD
jgi:hypothetical protein